MMPVCEAVGVVARDWTIEDTATFARWFREEPKLWQYVPGLVRPLTTTEIFDHVGMRLREQKDGTALVIAVDRGGVLACQFVVSPRNGAEGCCHIVVAPAAQGYGIELAKAGIARAQVLGIRKLIGLPSPLLPQDVYLRFVRRCGFNIRYFGEWVAE